MVNSNKVFCDNVNWHLEQLGWSRADLARKLKEPRSYVTIYLNGQRQPGLAVVDRFAVALGVDPVDLLSR